jgi:hypothetical protein
MQIEAISAPLTYRWPEGEVNLQPGKPIELPDDRALKLLAKAPGKVRIVVTSRVTPLVPGGCWACGQARFWLSTSDKLVCGVCHPPVDTSLVVEWLTA